jgi:hypothetical protein
LVAVSAGDEPALIQLITPPVVEVKTRPPEAGTGGRVNVVEEVCVEGACSVT